MPMSGIHTLEQIKKAVETDQLLPSTGENLSQWLSAGFLPEWAVSSIAELVEGREWEELNDRFFRPLEFGTGGMRGRTIGKVVTKAEYAGEAEGAVPGYAGVGSNLLNDFNVIRATLGLFRYTRTYLTEQKRGALPTLVIAHDVRNFSRHFCLLAASVWMRLGGVAYIYKGPRSTPQLSFSVRYLKAHAGIVITASHNPPHDNGYKVYFEDGAQVVSPHDKGIISQVERTSWDEVKALLDAPLVNPLILSDEMDQAYQNAVMESLLQPELLENSKGVKVVYTPIHGTGGVTIFPLLHKLGVSVHEVAEQSVMDGNFPTVKSPNPENAEALTMGLNVAKEVGADVVLATDPDCDRMGVAVPDEAEGWTLLSGNQIGAMMLHYALTQWKKKGWLTEENAGRSCLIKTFVTTPLQEVIGRDFGVKVLDTLTGFKWIGRKLNNYEKVLKEAVAKETGLVIDYDKLPAQVRREWLQRHSTAYIFGGEESYGYLASDLVRDKDGNAAVLLFIELLAALKIEGKTITGYLEELYRKYGYYEEAQINQYYEGASGSRKIVNILKSYRETPPTELGGFTVKRVVDFGREEIRDEDGEVIPAQDFFVVDLEEGFRYAVRGSGTEPKIKFYLFGQGKIGEADGLEQVRKATGEKLEALKRSLDADARQRAEGE